MAVIVEDYGTQYEVIAASQTDQVLGTVGEKGDFLLRLIIQVATAATGNVTLKDGATSIYTFTASPGGGIGSYVVNFNIKARTGPFKVTTGAGAAVLAVGNWI